MTETKHPADILDDASRQRWKHLDLIGVDYGDRLHVVSTEYAEQTQDLAEVVAMGFADAERHEAKIRMMHA